MNHNTQDVAKTWRKSETGGCLCQSLQQFRECKYYYPGDYGYCPWLDRYNYYKCNLKVSA